MAVYLQRAFLILALALTGCAQEMVLVPDAKRTIEKKEQSEYVKADALFENKQYVEALSLFQSFAEQYPGSEVSDDALFKIGVIYRILDQQESASSAFLRLVREYPESPLVPDAQLEIMTIDFEKDNFVSVIEQGVAYTGTTDPNLQRSPFFLIIADSYKAIGENLESVRYAYRAWNSGDGAQKKTAWEHFDEGLEQLTSTELQSLFVEVKNPDAQSTLLYNLGMAFVLEETYDDAIAALQLFVDRYPAHPKTQEVQEIILSIEERSRFTPYTVGCVLPLSGPYGVYGQRALNGIELALVESSSIADDVSFKLLIQDTVSDAQEAIKAVENLDRQRVGAVLGPMIASETAALTAQARGIPIFVFTQKEGIVDVGSYVFRNFITPRMQARSLVSYAVEELGARRFAILFPEENYGRHYMHLFWDEVIAYEAEVTSVEAYDPEGMDFAVPIKKLAGLFYRLPGKLSKEGVVRIPYPQLYLTVNPELAESGNIADPVERFSGLPLNRETIDKLGRRVRDVEDQWDPIINFDAIFIPDAPKKAGLIIPQLTYYDIRDVLLLGTNLWNSKSLIKMSGDYMKDVLITDGFFDENPSHNVRKFVTSFETIFGRKPGIIEAVAYDNAMMVFEILRTTATESRRELKQALLQTDGFEGITGVAGFFPNGEADKALQLLGLEKGRFVQIRRNSDLN